MVGGYESHRSACDGRWVGGAEQGRRGELRCDNWLRYRHWDCKLRSFFSRLICFSMSSTASPTHWRSTIIVIRESRLVTEF